MAKHDDMPRRDDPTELEPRPRPAPSPDRASDATVAQLRQDITSGATGDKVPVLDPAMSPLGTDEEAAGTPPSPGLVAAVRRAERTDPHPAAHPHDRGGSRLGLRLAGGLLLAVALAAVALWFSFA